MPFLWRNFGPRYLVVHLTIVEQPQSRLYREPVVRLCPLSERGGSDNLASRRTSYLLLAELYADSSSKESGKKT
jgi:hypothetical protein